MQKTKVIVAHPGRQHSHQLAFALQEGRLLERYYTVFWYNKSLFKKIERLLPTNVLREFNKRKFDPIDTRNVRINYALFLYEVLARLFKKRDATFKINMLFDNWVSNEIKSSDFDIFIGYETSSLNSFKTCKELGRICILDLAAEHYKKQNEIWDKIHYNPYGSELIRNEIDSIKEKELYLADFIFTLSDYAKETLINGGISEEKIIKIPVGVNLNVFKPKESYRRQGNFKILYVGAITIRKGLKYLLEAYKRLGLKDSELILIGGMADGKDILERYKELYHYIPFVSHEELGRFYQDADVFVFPSLLDSFAMTVIEAMACGTPVIVSENTGAKDVVREGVDGFIVPIMDVDALQEKILFFYKNRDKIEEMGRNARTQAEKYSWEIYRKRVRETIHNISTRSNQNRLHCKAKSEV